MYQLWYILLMSRERSIEDHFFRLDSSREPVREWLKSLRPDERKVIGEDIKTLQFGWPVGMPLARKMVKDLWELRSILDRGIARTFFTVYSDRIIRLHGFMRRRKRHRRTNWRLPNAGSGS
jgi:phage-related protein